MPPGVRCSFADGGTILRNAVARLTELTGDAGYAASVLLEEQTLAANTDVSPDDVLSAERSVIAAGFAGSSPQFRQALGKVRADARRCAGDRRRTSRAGRRRGALQPAGPCAQAVSDFLQTYASEPARLVEHHRVGAVARRRQARVGDLDARSGRALHARGAGRDRHSRRRLRRHVARSRRCRSRCCPRRRPRRRRETCSTSSHAGASTNRGCAAPRPSSSRRRRASATRCRRRWRPTCRRSCRSCFLLSS